MVKIVVLEDNDVDLMLYKEMLKKEECLCYITNNPYECLSMIMSGSVDAVITDIRMPILNGFDVIEHIRKMNKTIPIIVVTAQIDELTKSKAFILGASYFMEKPFEVSDFYTIIKNIIENLKKKS